VVEAQAELEAYFDAEAKLTPSGRRLKVIFLLSILCENGKREILGNLS
jgi:hypothetical protein